MGQAVQTAPVLSLDLQEAALPKWSLAKRIVFRFVCSYLMLYNLPMMGHVNLLDAIPGVPWLSAEIHSRMARHRAMGCYSPLPLERTGDSLSGWERQRRHNARLRRESLPGGHGIARDVPLVAP